MPQSPLAHALTRRELLEMIESTQPSRRERLPSSTYQNGIPRAALTELCGPAKVQWLVQFFKDNPDLKILWMEETFTLFPTAFLQRGLSPRRVIYVEAGKHLLKTLRRALKSQIFDCLVAPSVFKETRVLKALQLLSERSNAALILLADKAHSAAAWPIALQLDLHVLQRRPLAFEVRVLKEKGAAIGSPSVCFARDSNT